MPHIHTTFKDEEVRQLFAWYASGTVGRSYVLNQLHIKKSRFYELLKAYKSNPRSFSVAYGRDYANRKLPLEVIRRIRHEL